MTVIDRSTGGSTATVALPENWVLLPLDAPESKADPGAVSTVGVKAIELAEAAIRDLGAQLAETPLEVVFAACGVDAVDGRAYPIGATLAVTRIASQPSSSSSISDQESKPDGTGLSESLGSFWRTSGSSIFMGQSVSHNGFHFAQRSRERGLAGVLSFFAPAEAPVDPLIKRFSEIASTLLLEG
jgi:hypothetical protein